MDIALDTEDLDFAAEMRETLTRIIPAEIRERGARGEHHSAEDMRTSQRILDDHGLAVPHWPAEWGGRDWTPIQRHLFNEQLALTYVPPTIPFNTAMVGPVIATFGSQEQKQRFLPATASADIWWSQGFSEPNAGSDLASLKTSALRDGDEFVVNGQKTWTTLAQHADWIFCLVRTDPAAKKQQGISFLLLDQNSPGVTVRPIHLIDGGAEVNEVFFDNVRVPADQLVGEENKGWDYAKFLLGNERTNIAGVGGIKARIGRVKQVAAATAGGTGGSVLDDPLFRSRLTTLEVELTALEMSVMRVLAREAKVGHGKPDPLSSVLKIKGSELQQRATELLVDVVGPAGVAFREEVDLADAVAPEPDNAAAAMPTYFNTRKTSIYGGSNEVQRSIIAKAILKF